MATTTTTTSTDVWRAAHQAVYGTSGPMWVKRRDKRGMAYWYDQYSGAIWWKRRRQKEVAQSSSRAWKKCWTPDGSACFYYDAATDSVSWDHPPKGHRVANERRPGLRLEPRSSRWLKAWTDDDKFAFYQNLVTGQVVWEKPDDYEGIFRGDSPGAFKPSFFFQDEEATSRQKVSASERSSSTSSSDTVCPPPETSSSWHHHDHSTTYPSSRAIRVVDVEHDAKLILTSEPRSNLEPTRREPSCSPTYESPPFFPAESTAKEITDVAHLAETPGLNKTLPTPAEESAASSSSSSSSAESVVKRQREKLSPEEMRRNFMDVVWQLSALNRLQRTLEVAELKCEESRPSSSQFVRTSVKGSAPAGSGELVWHVVAPLAGIFRAMTRHGYAEVFFKRGGLELLLRTMIVLPKLCDESNFASIMAKSLILNCVDAAMSHLDSGLALTSSTRGLESLLADAVHEYKKKSNWQKQAAIVLQMLSALCVRKRGTDVGVAPHQVVVWNVVDALIARERGGEESPNPRAAELIPAVVAPNDDASLACASEPPLSLALEPPRFYDFVAFLLPTVPLAVARLALTLLRNLADSADTTLDRRRARAEISYALTLVAATHGINNHPEEDIVSSTTTTCFRTCALLWQLRRRAEQVVRDKVALHPGTTTTAEEAEALQILGTIDGLEGDEARDAEQQLNNSAATGGSRASCLASLVRSEAAASGPIALALADGVASVFEETAPPSLRTNARWTSGVAALNGALARLAVLRKASQEDDEAVRWRIETSRGTDELVESEKRLAAAQREYEALTDLAQGARRVRDVLRTHSAAKALNNNAASKEMLKLEVEKLEGDVDGAELLAIALPVVEERRRLPTARREVEAAIRQQSAEVSRLTAEAARAEASVERWRRRRDAAPGRVAARVQAEKTWADANRDIHAICLRALRRCMPVDVSRRTAADVRAAAAARYGSEESPKLAYPLRLCERLVLRKLLHVAVARPEHLTTGDFLRYGDRLFEEYTVGELRAVYAAVSAAVPPSDRDIPGNAEEPESRVRRWRAALAKGLQHAEAMPGQQQQQQQQDKTRSSLTLAKTLARVEGLSQLSRPELERLCEAVVVETFPHDAYVIREGDVGDAFYVIARGTCACATRGTEVARLAANAYFGERALLRDEPRAASVRCVGAVTVFKITRRAFDEVRSSIQNTLQAEHERRARASEAFSKLDSDANAAAHLCHSAYSYPSQTEVEAMRARALRPQRVADEKRARVAALDAELERARLDRDVRTAAARAVKKADADARGRATAASSAYRRIASERNRAREEAAAADAATVDAAALAECDAIDSCARWGLPVAPPFDAELSANPDEVVGPPPAYRAPPAIERTVVSFREKQASLLASFGSKKQTPPPRGFEVAKLDVNALKVAKDLESIFRKSSPPTKKPPSSHVGRLNKGSAIVSALESVFGGPSKKEQQQQQQQQEQEPTTGFKEESDQQKKESQEAEDGPATSSSGREGERVRKKPRTSTEIRTELDDLLGRLEQVSRPVRRRGSIKTKGRRVPPSKRNEPVVLPEEEEEAGRPAGWKPPPPPPRIKQ